MQKQNRWVFKDIFHGISVKPRENMTCDLPEMTSIHENEGDILKLDQFSQSAVLFDHHLILSVPHLTWQWLLGNLSHSLQKMVSQTRYRTDLMHEAQAAFVPVQKAIFRFLSFNTFNIHECDPLTHEWKLIKSILTNTWDKLVKSTFSNGCFTGSEQRLSWWSQYLEMDRFPIKFK